MKKYYAWMVLLLGIALLTGCQLRKQQEFSNKANGDEVVVGTSSEQYKREMKKEKMLEEQKRTPSPSSIPTPEVVLKEPEQEQVLSKEDELNPETYDLQIVFLGDSIFDNFRDSTGIPCRVAADCEAEVYNLAIGGTGAATEDLETLGNERWTSDSLAGVIKVLKGDVTPGILEGTRTKEIIETSGMDLSKTDYFVIACGIGDYFHGISQSNPEDYYDLRTYAGALRYAVTSLREMAPDASIVLCSPHYCIFYENDWMVGDGNTLSNGKCILRDYKETCEYISGECQTLFLNTYDDLEINGYTADKYLEDGVHLSEDGRRMYADALTRVILQNEKTKNN